MSTDRLYVHGGADAVDGNYEDDETVGSRRLRLHCAQRGNWTGGRGRLIGSRLVTLTKMDEETINEVPRMIEEADRPLLESGEISDVVTNTEQYVDREGVLGYESDYTDRTTGDADISTVVPVGWEG